MAKHKTLVGDIDAEVLAFTAGRDPVLDRELLEEDCLGTAAHVTMLAAVRPRPLLSGADRDRVLAALVGIMRKGRKGGVRILAADQDVHLAVERMLTASLGDLGRRIHTARSRNDQVAVDLRLYAKTRLLDLMDETAALATALLRMARRQARVPMVGRTHLQPAMPSSVGLWASAYAEGLAEDIELLRTVYRLNDRSPLGSAAGYGVPVPIDRELTAGLLGFAGPIHNVLHASHARGKLESAILAALVQVMLTLSRLAEDLILFAMPEFGYVELPPELCTGSSIMPQKKNPDVLELVRARTARMLGLQAAAGALLKALPAGYNRDLQETKEPLMDGLATTRSCVRIVTRVVEAMTWRPAALEAGFCPGVFAADRALERVARGVPFRTAYQQVRDELDRLEKGDSLEALEAKRHSGAPGGLDFALLSAPWREVKKFARRERKRYHASISRMLKIPYPELKAEQAG